MPHTTLLFYLQRTSFPLGFDVSVAHAALCANGLDVQVAKFLGGDFDRQNMFVIRVQQADETHSEVSATYDLVNKIAGEYGFCTPEMCRAIDVDLKRVKTAVRNIQTSFSDAIKVVDKTIDNLSLGADS